MQLQEIDKERYSKHFKQTFIGVVLVLLLIAVPVSTLLIQLFGDSDGSNTLLNLAGVVVAAFVVGALFRKYRTHQFLHEVMYVWDLKQVLNKIYRKQKQIKQAMTEGDRVAMLIMNYSYQGSKQLYNLDNNTITMDELNRDMVALDKLLDEYGYQVTLEEFDVELLQGY
ncbi:DUF3087 family protein [Amphritea sp. HPY]|uniref:DUF3087 family protein n=1 Tax=Amphritea sp. HPY TaxID=3421652 RepID=UPI003D7EEF70